MTEYTESFTGLVDQFAMKYVDGLHDGIKATIIIYHPLYFDIVIVLAKLQEDVLDTSKKCEFKCLDYSSARPPFKSALPLPPHPPWVDRVMFPSVDDRHGTKAAQARGTPEKWFALALIAVPVVYVRSVLKIGQRTIAIWILFNSM